VSVRGYLLFVVPSLLSVLGMWILFEDFRGYSALLMIVASGSGALLAQIVQGFLLKRWLAPLRGHLALAIEDPARREQLIEFIPLVTKLQVVIVASTLVPVIFAIFMAQTRSSDSVEELVSGLQASRLEEALATYEHGGLGELEELRAERSTWGFPAELLVVDLETGRVVLGAREALRASELAWMRESVNTTGEHGADRGDGADLHSANVFSWASLGEGEHVVVVSSDWNALTGNRSDFPLAFGLLLLATAALALGLAWLLAEDVGASTRQLKDGAERVASGDLRRLRVVESEDELGLLGHAVERMTTALRGTLGEVAQAADGVESTAREISDVANGVSASAMDQGREVKQAAGAMEELRGQVSGVARSSSELNLLVEEASSSILEVGASGEQLAQTAGVLSGRVDEVSASVEQAVHSVKEVGRHTDTLSDAASETSSSMEEMASAMRLVDSNAAQTAELSEQAVSAAESGREKVRETIEGMESIRGATESAQNVIVSLGERTQEIGAILDVIDDVADETNLLALNAAIIAAQAGEHGRAFSVVADEIKELADRVLASTKEIGALIHSVQNESENAIGAIRKGTASVATGMERSREAGASLDEITRISRGSGTRIREIVQSVKEQTKAAGHVVELMDRVTDGVDAIRRAASEQESGNQVVFRSTQSMGEVARQLHTTTEEQARGSARIRENIEGVRDAVEAIDSSLQSQSASCAEVAGFLEEVSSRSMANDTSARLMTESTQTLTAQAQNLRDSVDKFRR
jgi:methyl-accepting chemotaxis protein